MTEKQVCYYPGTYNPPNKFHLSTAQWLVDQNNVSQVIIVIGKSQPGEISQDKKAEIWEIFLRGSYSSNIGVEKAETSPLKYIYDEFTKKPEEFWFIGMDVATARDETIMKKFDIFPNYQVQVIPSQFDGPSKNMLKAVEIDDFDTFEEYLPDELPAESRKLCYDVLRTKELEETIGDKDWRDTTLMGMFSKYK